MSSNRQAPTPRPADAPRRLTSEQLFAGADQVVIRHRDADYLLRLTRQGKLILTK